LKGLGRNFEKVYTRFLRARAQFQTHGNQEDSDQDCQIFQTYSSFTRNSSTSLSKCMENVLSIICNLWMGNLMAKCPKCGTEVATPRKSWKMASRKDKSGKRTELTIGLFDHCGKSFRAVLAKRKI